jgi:hypothetical protein
MSEQQTGIPADIQRFFIPVELDRRRVLAFDNRATFLVFQRYGAGFWRELYEPDPHKPNAFRIKSLEALEFFLWAALLRDADTAGETISLEDVAALILPDTIVDLSQALLVALSATRKRQRDEDKRKNA